MSKRRIVFFFTVVAVLILAAAYYFYVSDRVVVRNYSQFQSYQFNAQPGLGFCPEPNSIVEATIERAGPGALIFSATVLQAREGNLAECSAGIDTNAGCMDATAQPPRPLTSEEVVQITSLFSEIELHPNPDSICRTIAIDPCLIGRHTWDDRTHDDYVCSSDRMPYDGSKNIMKMLKLLHDDS